VSRALKVLKRTEDDAKQVVADEAAAVKRHKKLAKAGADSGYNYYVEHDETAAMPMSRVEEIRTEMNCTVLPDSAGTQYKPLEKFTQIDPSLGDYCNATKKYFKVKGFEKPSPIQSQCWPPLMAGEDVIGIAATGSGKTLGFLIPGLLKLARLGPNPQSPGTPSPRILIVAPTRELAMQSDVVVREMNECRGLCIYGGVSKGLQKAELRKGVDVVVATPGRLLDLVQEGALSLKNIVYLVLDEADRMLDDGFEVAIREIIKSCPGHKERQTVMFSATWPEEIRELAKTFLKPRTVRVVIGGEELSANHRVTQIVECIDVHGRDKRVVELLRKYHDSKNKILIFILYKKEATTVQRMLEQRGFNVGSIHGDKAQHERTASLEDFKTGKVPLLLATDVAARGLDIPQVEYVINYSFPLTVEDYVHRIGRTGRGGRTGTSHTFFTDNDKTLAGQLVGVLQKANQEVPQDIYKYPMMTKKKVSKNYGAFGPKDDLAGQTATRVTFGDDSDSD